MLLILLTWTFILSLGALYGHLSWKLFQRVTGSEQGALPHISLMILSGWVLLCSLAAGGSLLFPLKSGILLGLTVFATVYGIWQRESIGIYLLACQKSLKKSSWVQLALVGLAALSALLFSATPPLYYDDGLYYWQFIKWTNEYGALPGLGNLHPRLAFNSNWHVLASLFSFSFLSDGPLNDLNGLLHLLVAIYAVSGLRRLLQPPYRVSDVLQASLLIPTHLILGYFNGPSADAAVVYLAWICFILFIRKIEEDSLDRFDLNSFLIFSFCTFVCTVKLSAFPVVVLPLFILFQVLRKQNYQALSLLIGLGLFLCLPWLGRNLVLSGYAFFPFYQIDLFAFDWKVPLDLVKEEVSYIEAFAAGESLVRAYPYPEILEMGFAEWFPIWYGDLRTANKGIFYLVCLLSMGYLAYFLFGLVSRGTSFLRDHFGYLILFSSLFLGLAFWFLKAPDFRFGYAYTVALYLISFSFLVVALLKSSDRERLIWWGLAGLLFLFSLRPLQIGGREYYYASKAANSYYLVFPGLPADLAKKTYTTPGGLILFESTQNDQCWDSPLPCTPFPRNGLELLDKAKGVAGGFQIQQADLEYYRNMQIGYQPLPEEKKSARFKQAHHSSE